MSGPARKLRARQIGLRKAAFCTGYQAAPPIGGYPCSASLRLRPAAGHDRTEKLRQHRASFRIRRMNFREGSSCRGIVLAKARNASRSTGLRVGPIAVSLARGLPRRKMQIVSPAAARSTNSLSLVATAASSTQVTSNLLTVGVVPSSRLHSHVPETSYGRPENPRTRPAFQQASVRLDRADFILFRLVCAKQANPQPRSA